MNKIGIFALGGLAENGKNMYVVEASDKLFIFDAGLKYPTSELFGIDEIIPDFTMLIPAKKRIQGIFISHPHEDHIGALSEILKTLNVPVYATNLAMEIIKDDLVESGHHLEDLTLVTVTSDDVLEFGDVKIGFFDTTHSIPESVGIYLETDQGVVVYTSEFTFNQYSYQYQTDFKKISELANKGVIAALIESVGSLNMPSPGANEVFNNKLNNVFIMAPGRIIVTLFSSDLQKIQSVIDIALTHHKRIAVLGRKAQRIVDLALKMGYLKIPEDAFVNLKFLDAKVQNNDPDLVCLVTGSRHEPFYMLQRIIKGVDLLINLEPDDTVILLTTPVPGIEKMESRTLDMLYRSDAEVVTFDRHLLSTSHSNAEEIKMMISLLRPKYIIPVIGEYRHQFSVKKFAMELGYDEKNIIILDNGDVVNISPYNYYISRGDIAAGDILIDGTPIVDKNDVVMRDRALLAEDGAVIIIANVSAQEKKVLGDVEILTSGFVYEKEAEVTITHLKKIFLEVSDKILKSDYINWNDYKRQVRDETSKYIYKVLKRSPMILPVIIATELD